MVHVRLFSTSLTPSRRWGRSRLFKKPPSTEAILFLPPNSFSRSVYFRTGGVYSRQLNISLCSGKFYSIYGSLVSSPDGVLLCITELHHFYARKGVLYQSYGFKNCSQTILLSSAWLVTTLGIINSWSVPEKFDQKMAKQTSKCLCLFVSPGCVCRMKSSKRGRTRFVPGTTVNK